MNQMIFDQKSKRNESNDRRNVNTPPTINIIYKVYYSRVVLFIHLILETFIGTYV